MNDVKLIGNLVRDPELKTTPNGNYVCSFTIAVQRKRANKDGVKEADYIRCTAWRNTAEYISKYCSKGIKVAISGALQSRNYEKDGQKLYSMEVVLDEYNGVEIMTPKGYTPGAQGGNAAETATSTPQVDPNTGYVQVDPEELPF